MPEGAAGEVVCSLALEVSGLQAGMVVFSIVLARRACRCLLSQRDGAGRGGFDECFREARWLLRRRPGNIYCGDGGSEEAEVPSDVVPRRSNVLCAFQDDAYYLLPQPSNARETIAIQQRTPPRERASNGGRFRARLEPGRRGWA